MVDKGRTITSSPKAQLRVLTHVPRAAPAASQPCNMPHHLAADPEMGEHPSHHRSPLRNRLARMTQVQLFKHTRA